LRVIISILTISSILSCSNRQDETARTSEQSSPTISYGVPYDSVVLKNNSKLIYYTTDQQRKLRFKGEEIDTIIQTIDIDELEKYMGWLKTDFNNYFVLNSSGGLGIYEMRLLDKRTGKEIIRGIEIENDTINNIIYYQDEALLDNNLTLFNIEKLRKETFTPPAEIHCIQWWQCIDKIVLTDNELALTYFSTPETKRVKKYVR
jgi:hypothetical protein